MSSINDWESLMNGVFGSGGRFRSSVSAPKEEKKSSDAGQAPAPGKAPASWQPAGADPMETLRQNSQKLDDALARQAREIAAMGDSLTRRMEQDGLLEPQPARQEAPDSSGETFRAIRQALEEKVLGQPEFLKKLVMAFRRPFVSGTGGDMPKNLILICGPEGTGRHYALRCLAQEMGARNLLKSPEIAWMELSAYPDPSAEKLFLQDLFGALNAPGEILAFDEYEQCHPAFLQLLAQLALTGSAPLDSRYVLQKGMLVDAGTALVPNAVSRLSARGKYLVFFSHQGTDQLARVLGAAFVNGLGDVCATTAFREEDLSALAARQLNELAQRVKARLGLTLQAGEDLRNAAAAQGTARQGAEPVLSYTERLFKALSQYVLEQEPPAGGTVRLEAREGRVTAFFGGPQGPESDAAPVDLFSLLPGAYTGEVEAVRAQLDRVVGLAPVKEYVLGLADNVAAQQRRRAQGLKTSGLNMHMIFAGNPGTGKTTIARLVGSYLKAIGALSGGQLVEVSRADLVGRYVGHTAPLTNQVIHSALGGVLFIDEAYSLYRGQEDSFGLEAIDTLVKGIEDHRDELVVILAGYTREMQSFLEANSGLASRFPNFIQFPDYSAQELLQITHLQAEDKGYRLEEGCDEPLREYYARRQAQDAAKAGNGRLARNTLEAAILNQSRRLAGQPQAPLDLLLREDFELS